MEALVLNQNLKLWIRWSAKFCCFLVKIRSDSIEIRWYKTFLERDLSSRLSPAHVTPLKMTGRVWIFRKSYFQTVWNRFDILLYTICERKSKFNWQFLQKPLFIEFLKVLCQNRYQKSIFWTILYLWLSFFRSYWFRINWMRSDLWKSLYWRKCIDMSVSIWTMYMDKG